MTSRDALVGSLLHRALSVADSAGRMLVDERPEHLHVESKAAVTDIVTEMDRRSEDLITERLLDGRPGDGVLGEEGAQTDSTSGVRWVVDPIDGTVNYLYRIPVWSVCIGVELDGAAVAGVVAAPALGETYFAAVGGPAKVRTRAGDRVLRVGSQRELDLALVATGFGYSPDRRARQGALVARLLPQVRDIRRAGTASIDICWLADGRLDGYFEVGLKPWDFTAAMVVARQAGAVVEGLRGEAPGEPLVLAANPGLIGTMRDVLEAAGIADVL